MKTLREKVNFICFTGSRDDLVGYSLDKIKIRRICQKQAEMR